MRRHRLPPTDDASSTRHVALTLLQPAVRLAIAMMIERARLVVHERRQQVYGAPLVGDDVLDDLGDRTLNVLAGVGVPEVSPQQGLDRHAVVVAPRSIVGHGFPTGL